MGNQLWSFLIRIKRRTTLEEIPVLGGEDDKMNPILFLLELRKRVRASRHGKHNNTFWTYDDGKAMSVRAIRASTVRFMKKAGIKDTHGYHIKV
jgi:hypothetical protein